MLKINFQKLPLRLACNSMTVLDGLNCARHITLHPRLICGLSFVYYMQRMHFCMIHSYLCLDNPVT